MEEAKIRQIYKKQKNYFSSNITLDVNFRLKQLKKLRNSIKENEDMLMSALKKDLNKSEAEAYLCDIGPTIFEIDEIIKNFKKWAKPEKHFSGVACFPSFRTNVLKMPYGNCLIISPFNFPVLLSLGVLAACISAGNTAVLKCSSKSKYTTKALKKLISTTFKKKYIAVIDGGHDVADILLDMPFDKVFYTGSPKIGKHVLSKSAKNLTPVALELGGETGNWCIVRKDANLKDAARKIAFFKACNSGQICININQVAVAQEVAKEFLTELKKAFKKQLGINPVQNSEYPKLINETAFSKCENQVKKYYDKIIYGGNGNHKNCKFAPTVLYPIDINDEIVQQELFNPILPVVPYRDKEIDKVLKIISSRQHGLALYVFTRNKKWARKVMSTMQYGGGCINEVCVHIMVKGVPFNGVGHSGMGAYHGEWGFREFSHPCTVLEGKTHFNLSLREHPYKNKIKIMKMFM